jgi:hypothetical protein
VNADDVPPKPPKAPTAAVVSSSAKAPPNSTGFVKAPSGALPNPTVPQIQSKEPIQADEPGVATEYQSKVIPSHPKVPKTKQEVLKGLRKGIDDYLENQKPGGHKEQQQTAHTVLEDDVKKLVSEFTDTLKHGGSGEHTGAVVEEAPELGE